MNAHSVFSRFCSTVEKAIKAALFLSVITISKLLVPPVDSGDNQTLSVKDQYTLDEDKPSKHLTGDLKIYLQGWKST